MMWLVALFAHEAKAQNVQIHYDFGRSIYSTEESDRQKVTVTYKTFFLNPTLAVKFTL